MKKILKNKKGFTLMELIIVIAVIAILAAIAIPSYMKIIERAEKTEATALARNAYSLAQIELLCNQIDNTTPTTYVTGDYTHDKVGDEFAFEDGDKVHFEITGFTVTSAVVTTKEGWVATATNGSVAVGETKGDALTE